MPKIELTAQRLRELLDYSPDTGLFTWRKRGGPKAPVGSVAGGPDSNGYVKIGIDGEDYRAQRLAWLHYYGEWPKLDVGHLDGRIDNNAISNLRDLPQAVVQQGQRKAHADSLHGFLGVTKRKTKWMARISIDRVVYYLGVFTTPEEAHRAYLDAKREKATFGKN